MSPLPDLLPAGAGLRLDDLTITLTCAVLRLSATSASATCPRCGIPSDRVHSRYLRTVADLPVHDRPVALRVHVRRFRCINPGCPCAIFCERLPSFLQARARSTERLTDAHRAVGFALGGEAGARLAAHLDMPTSADTLLRRVKSAPDEPAPPPRYIGVDDWALRKGHTYGTLLFDLERGRVLDILPGRDGAALKAWLQEHPGVEVITRDRWAAFAQAAAEGAPQAQQIADRWHLLKNLREVVAQALERRSVTVRAALREPLTAEVATAVEPAAPTSDGPLAAAPAAAPVDALPVPVSAPLSLREQVRQAKQQRRVERYQRVHQLRSEGQSLRQIAQATGLSAKCVIHYLRIERCPDWKPGRHLPTPLDAFTEPVEEWLAQGGRNIAELWRVLTASGCQASYHAVCRFVNRRVGGAGRRGPRTADRKPVAPAPPSARQLSFETICRPEERKEAEQARLNKLRGADTELRDAIDLAAEFVGMVGRQTTITLAEWLTKAEESDCAELRNYAAGLRRDESAVAAAMTEEWSNGPVEGAVNRLKLIKRSMYGRAGWELLRARVRKAS